MTRKVGVLLSLGPGSSTQYYNIGQCLQGQCRYGKPSMPHAADRTVAHVAVAMLSSGVPDKGALHREYVLSRLSFLSRGIF